MAGNVKAVFPDETLTLFSSTALARAEYQAPAFLSWHPYFCHLTGHLV
jgi:hypothetical protein